MNIARVALCAGWLWAVSMSAGAVSFSRGVLPETFATMSAPVGAACGNTFLTQSAAQTIAVGNSVSCNSDGFIHAENSYYRAYDLAAFIDGFDVCSVDIGIDRARAGATTQPVTLNIYANTGDAFPAGASTLLATSAIALSDQTATVLNVPISARVPAGAQLVVEVFTPDGRADGNAFLMGSNALGQSAPSFLRAPNCGVFAPTQNVAGGFPQMQIVLNAHGTPAPGVPRITTLPGTVEFGSVEIGRVVTATTQLLNDGTAAVEIISIAAPPAPFTQTLDTCSGRLLQINQSCELTYQFSPLAVDTVSTSLLVASNADAANINLRGTGVIAAPIPGPNAIWLSALALCIVALAGRRLDNG